jgi:hypothetical protein
MPGQKAPFDVIFDQYAGTADYQVQVQGQPASDLPYTGLVVKNTGERVDDINYWHLVGEVTNEGDDTAEFVQIVATLYDEAGIVVGTAFTFTDLDILSPGATSPFELTVGDEIDFARYLVQVQGQVR